MRLEEAEAKVLSAYQLLLEVHTARHDIARNVHSEMNSRLLTMFATTDSLAAARRLLSLVSHAPVPVPVTAGEDAAKHRLGG